MAVIGYIRVSSNKQTCEHQHFEIQQFAEHNKINVDKWVEETISSRKALNKRKLGQLLDELQDGDILIAAEISRLGRSLLEVMRILETCLNKNCQVWTSRFYAKPVTHRWQVQDTLTTGLNTMQKIHQIHTTLPQPRSDCQMLRTLIQQMLII